MLPRLPWSRLAIVPLIIGLCLAVSGCGGRKLTKDMADQIKKGMTEQEVIDILGPPKETQKNVNIPELGKTDIIPTFRGMRPGGGTSATWKDGDKTISVTYVDGKVYEVFATGF
jgi:hypothetical protein